MIVEKGKRSERNIITDGALHLMIHTLLSHHHPHVLLGETTTRTVIPVRGIHRGVVEMGMIKESVIDTAMTNVSMTKKLPQRVMVAGMIKEMMVDSKAIVTSTIVREKLAEYHRLQEGDMNEEEVIKNNILMNGVHALDLGHVRFLGDTYSFVPWVYGVYIF